MTGIRGSCCHVCHWLTDMSFYQANFLENSNFSAFHSYQGKFVYFLKLHSLFVLSYALLFISSFSLCVIFFWKIDTAWECGRRYLQNDSEGRTGAKDAARTGAKAISKRWDSKLRIFRVISKNHFVESMRCLCELFSVHFICEHFLRIFWCGWVVGVGRQNPSCTCHSILDV